MLKDLSKTNQILYYITSMSLSIILFILKIVYDNFQDNPLTHFHVFIMITLVTITLLLLSRRLHRSLRDDYNSEKFYKQDNYNSSKFSIEHISEINGQPVSLLITNVSSIFIISSFPIPSILAFLFIHIMLFAMMIKGQNLQPNPFLYIFGIDIYKTKNNDFLINLNDKKLRHNNILKLNDSENGRTYIVGDLDKSL